MDRDLVLLIEQEGWIIVNRPAFYALMPEQSSMRRMIVDIVRIAEALLLTTPIDCKGKDVLSDAFILVTRFRPVADHEAISVGNGLCDI
jgi:hypothetical protein